MENKKLSKNGFTLLELLVVVLIIGILAGIALPKYQLAVAKSKYSTLKTISKNYAAAINRYYLANNIFPSSLDDLDIVQPKISEQFYCSIVGERIACFDRISGIFMGHYRQIMTYSDALCYVLSLDVTHVTHKICQQETGKTTYSFTGCNDRCALYYYY